MTYNVREYVPKPMRCYNCQRFGHTASTCKGKRIQIIVKAAVNHLNFTELPWEEVRNELSAQASQEVSFVG